LRDVATDRPAGTAAGHTILRAPQSTLRISGLQRSFPSVRRWPSRAVLASASSTEDEALGAVPERRTGKWRSRWDAGAVPLLYPRPGRTGPARQPGRPAGSRCHHPRV